MATAKGQARKRTPRVLVIDDRTSYAKIVEERLPELSLCRPSGTEDGRFSDGRRALRYLERNAASVDVVLLDLHFDLPQERLLPLEEGASLRRTRRFQGVAILRELRRRLPRLPVVLLTAERDLSLVDLGEELSPQSMTYLLDGDDLDTLRIRIHSALSESALSLEESDVLWGRDSSMAALRRRLSVVARGQMPVILEGETGTGKSFLAEQFVHRNSGRSGPFVVLDLSPVPRELVAAQLFGAVRGAYTGAVADRKGVFEAAHRGTLFIDEVQNTPLEVQKQLLLVLQERKVCPIGGTRQVPIDVKVVAASNTPLQAAVNSGQFRSDLYMRLSPATRVEIPPLRERPGDLRFFAGRFTERALNDPDLAELRNAVAAALGLAKGAPLQLVVGREQGPESGLSLAVPEPGWERLSLHPWPGNLRELAMVMHNLVAFTLVEANDALRAGATLSSRRLQVDTGLIGALLSGAASLGQERPEVSVDAGIQVRIAAAKTLNQVAQDVERQYLRALFADSGGTLETMAERLLGDASRTRAVRLRLNQLGIKLRELRASTTKA